MPKTDRRPPELTQQQRAARISANVRTVESLARRIERLVAAAPPLTEAQRARLVTLLGGTITPAPAAPARIADRRGRVAA